MRIINSVHKNQWTMVWRAGLLLFMFLASGAVLLRAQSVTLLATNQNIFVGANYSGVYSNSQLRASLSGIDPANPVILSVSGAPVGAAILFSTNGYATSSSSLVISNSWNPIWYSVAVTNVAKGIYPLTFSASGGASASVGVNLIVGDLWTNADPSGDVTWGQALNWSTGTPVAGDDVLFQDAGYNTNYVDNSIGLGSLSFLPARSGTNQNMVLGPGVTLSVVGTNGFIVNNDSVTAGGKTFTLNVAGLGAALVVSNSQANFAVNGDSTGATGTTLNMTNLDNFSATINRFGLADWTLIKQGGVGAQMVLASFAKTNLVTAGYVGDYTVTNNILFAISIANNGDLFNNGAAYTVNLGKYNSFAGDSFAAGQSRTGSGNSTVRFNPVFTNGNLPYVSFRSTNGGRMSLVGAGVDSGVTAPGSNSRMTMNFSGGIVDMLVDTMWLGRNRAMNTATNSGALAQGILTFTGGKVDVNYLRAGYMAYTNNSTANGQINVGGSAVTNAVLVVNNTLEMGYTAGDFSATPGSIAAATSAQLVIKTNGVVRANQITVGSFSTNNTITVNNGGTLVISNAIADSTKGLTSLNLDGAQLTVSVVAGAVNVYVTNFNVITASKINIASLSGFTSYPATNVIISYQTAASHVGLGIGTVPAGFNNLTLNDNTANKTIELIISTNAPRTLLWRGPGSTWDHSSYNWVDTNTLAANKFTDGDKVIFDDASGVPTSITISETVLPSQSGVGVYITNSVNDYVFTTNAAVSSGIEGGATLVKDGSATIQLDAYANVAAQVNAGRVTGGGVIGSLTTASNTFFGWSGSLLSSLTLGSVGTNSGTLSGGITLNAGAAFTNSGAIHGVLSVNTGAAFENLNLMDNLGSSVVGAGGTFINAGTIVGDNLTVNGTLKDMGVGYIELVGTLTINGGGTFIPGGDGIGTTIVKETSDQDPFSAGTVKFAAGSTNIFKVDPGAGGQNCTKLLSNLQLLGPSQGTVQTNGGIIVVTNIGTTAFASGQSFKFFGTQPSDGTFSPSQFTLNTTNSYPVMQPAYPAMGLSWDLSQAIFNGTIAIGTSPLPQTPTNITFSASGNVLTLSWPADYTGWRLLMQTNSLTTGLGTNWIIVPGSTATNSMSITNDLTTPAAFFRLGYPYP